MSVLKTLSISIFFCMASYAPGAYALNLIEPNCDNVKVSFGDDNNYSSFRPKVTWKETGTFPSPTKTIEVVSDDSKNIGFSFQCPDFSVSYDNKILTIKAKDYERVLELIKQTDTPYSKEGNKIDYDLNLYSHSRYEYPNILRGSKTTSYGLNLKNIDLKTSRVIANEGQELAHQFSGISNEVVIAYRVDGKKLKALLFERNISQYKSDIVNANQIDIYHKNPELFNKGKELLGIQRVFIDKKEGVLKVYRSYDFPID